MRFLAQSLLGTLLAFCTGLGSLYAVEPDASVKPRESVASGEDTSDAILVGHSYHGEAFNEGPRQAATLIDGLANIDFPTSTKDEQAQRFFEQGVAQLHGFWYLEAERSFRQAAMIDPEMAIAYWGMAMANINNPERARGLIDEATTKAKGHASKREELYIDALSRFIPPVQKEDEKELSPENKEQEKEAKRKRAERYIVDLEKIIDECPDDIEAKAFLAVHLWQAGRQGVKLTSYYAVDALLSEIFAVNPQHPAHHYRIHLWDRKRAENAVTSSAACGPSMPAVAHMWHMPGHIYSKLHRYHDAAWQQEASARVDHAHMTRVRIIPDQIHNFAHNNEWFTRNLLFVGRVSDAIEQAENLISLPRHPRFNTLEKRGSFQYGRTRLFQALTEYALWEKLVQATSSAMLPPTDDSEAQAERLGWLAVAQFRLGDRKDGAKTLRQLQRRRIALETKRLDLADGAADAKGKDDDNDTNEKQPETSEDLGQQLEKLRTIIARAAAAAATSQKKPARVKTLGEKAKLDKLILARWLADAGDRKAAIEISRAELKKRKNQVRPLAILVDLLWRDGNKTEAQETFQKLRKVASDANVDTPLLACLSPVAKSLKIQGDWRIAREPAKDVGDRPDLSSLGPATWQRYRAPSWQATTADGNAVSDGELDAKPRIIIFYLGFGCLHCVEQLHEFGPKLRAFQTAGIDVVGISNEDAESLAQGLENFGEPIAIPLFADPKTKAFRDYRCWDDFESQPLHGTFLVDQNGRVLWQDISYEPFMDADFLLKEAKRLLKLP